MRCARNFDGGGIERLPKAAEPRGGSCWGGGGCVCGRGPWSLLGTGRAAMRARIVWRQATAPGVSAPGPFGCCLVFCWWLAWAVHRDGGVFPVDDRGRGQLVLGASQLDAHLIGGLALGQRGADPVRVADRAVGVFHGHVVAVQL